VWLWDWAEVEASAPPATAEIRRGGVATISQDDGLLTCLECGDQRRWRSLGRHLQARHDMTADQYRAAHRLPASAALECDGLRQQGRDRMLMEPHRTSHLQAYQDASRLDAMREEAIASIRATQDYETVRESRAQARRSGVRAMVSTRADQLATLVQAHGYTDPRQAVEQTRALSVRDAAAATGLSKTTIRRRRNAADPFDVGGLTDQDRA
jgi:hypothetical protein